MWGRTGGWHRPPLLWLHRDPGEQIHHPPSVTVLFRRLPLLKCCSERISWQPIRLLFHQEVSAAEKTRENEGKTNNERVFLREAKLKASEGVNDGYAVCCRVCCVYSNAEQWLPFQAYECLKTWQVCFCARYVITVFVVLTYRHEEAKRIQ